MFSEAKYKLQWSSNNCFTTGTHIAGMWTARRIASHAIPGWDLASSKARDKATCISMRSAWRCVVGIYIQSLFSNRRHFPADSYT